jgi:hypothetical protein
MDTVWIDRLCLSCGLCCNGVLFRDVELRPNDDAVRLKEVGLQIKTTAKKKCFTQPCAALNQCQCRVYPDRPRMCREFECLLLKQAAAGIVEIEAALRLIRKTLKKADGIRALFQDLGCQDETGSFSRRFRQIQRRMESTEITEDQADSYARLTLAVHELNMMLRQSFYPDPAD